MNVKHLSAKNGFSKKKRILLNIMLSLVLALLALKIMPNVLAVANKEIVEDSFTTFMNGFTKSAFDQMKSAYENFSSFLSVRGNEGFTKEVYDMFESFGYVLLLFGSIIYILKEAQKGDEFGMDFWLKLFINTTIAFLLILQSSEIFSALYELGGIMIKAASENLKSGLQAENYFGDLSDIKQKILAGIPDENSPTSIIKTVVEANPNVKVNWYQIQSANKMLTIMNYIVYFPMLIMIFLTFSAIFELKLREVAAPMAVASVAHEGTRGSGVRYIKKYFACYIKIVIYFIIAAIAQAMTRHFYSQAGASTVVGAIDINLIFMMLTNLVGGMAMMQTGGIGDEIVGV